MSILTTLLNVIRGHAARANEELVDSQAIILAEVGIKSAQGSLDQAQTSLVSIIASKKLAEQKAAELKTNADQLEQRAMITAEKDVALAEKLALQAAASRGAQAREEANVAKFTTEAAQIEARIKTSKASLERMRQELDSLKANQKVIDAQVATSIAIKDGSANLAEAKTNLDRLKEKQLRQQASIDAAESYHADNDTDALLAQADALSAPASGSDALAALLAKKGPSSQA